MPIISNASSFSIGTPVNSGSSGSVLFIDSTGKVAQDNTNFKFDDGTNSLTVGGNLVFTTNDTSVIGADATRPNKIWVGTGGLDLTGPIKLVTGGVQWDWSAGTLTVTGGATATFASSSGVAILQGQTSANIRCNLIQFGNANNAAILPLAVSSTGAVWGSGGTYGNIVEQRNGTSSQTFSIYDTYIDASNYRRLRTYLTSDTFTISAEKAGSPATPALMITSAGITKVSGDTRLDLVSSSGAAKIFFTSSGFRPSSSGAFPLGTSASLWSTLFCQRAIFSPSDNVQCLIINANNLTGANAATLVDINQTWNTTGSPTLFKINITNTAVGANAKIFDFQVGSTSYCQLTKNGRLVSRGYTAEANTFANLPNAIVGTIACVTDSTVNTHGATVAGGGANTVLCWYNGTNWTVIGI